MHLPSLESLAIIFEGLHCLAETPMEVLNTQYTLCSAFETSLKLKAIPTVLHEEEKDFEDPLGLYSQQREVRDYSTCPAYIRNSCMNWFDLTHWVFACIEKMHWTCISCAHLHVC